MTSVRARHASHGFAPPLVEGGVQLPSRLTRSDRGADRGWPAIVSRLAWLAMGTTVIALWGHWPELLRIALPVAVLAAAAALVHVVRRVRWDVKAKRLRATYPAEPWRWDHEWDERGIRDDYSPRDAAATIAAGALLAVFAVGASALSFGALITGSTALRLFALPFVALALVVDYAVVRLFFDGARLTARGLKYGRGVALFDSFPFRRGEPLSLHVTAPRALPQHAPVTATIRCIQERLLTAPRADDGRTVQCFEVYRDSARAELLDTGSGARRLRARFAVPPDAPASDLASYPCRYWEVELEARTDGVDYGARFLVPVY